MDKLDQVDLSLKMSRAESERELVALQRRLLHLRLLAGGLDRRRTSGPALVRRFRGLGRLRQGGCDQAARRRPRPPPCPGPVLRALRPSGRSVTISCGASGPIFPGCRRHGRLRPFLVRPRPGRDGWRALRPRRNGRGPTTTSSFSSAAWPRTGWSWSSSGSTYRPRSSWPVSNAAATTPSGSGSSPTRTGATARSDLPTSAAVDAMLARTDHKAAPWELIAAGVKALRAGRRVGDGYPPAGTRPGGRRHRGTTFEGRRLRHRLTPGPAIAGPAVAGPAAAGPGELPAVAARFAPCRKCSRSRPTVPWLNAPPWAAPSAPSRPRTGGTSRAGWSRPLSTSSSAPS